MVRAERIDTTLRIWTQLLEYLEFAAVLFIHTDPKSEKLRGLELTDLPFM